MSKKEHVSATPATMWLKQHKVPFEDGIYEYVEHGGTAQAAACFGVDEHNVVKTLIMQDEHEKPLVILMHGDREVSTKNLARQTNRKHIEPCKPAIKITVGFPLSLISVALFPMSMASSS